MLNELYIVFHRASGLGAKLIRMKNPGSWPNHVSLLLSTSDDPDWLGKCSLYESRSKHGVTGGTFPGTRTLDQAIEGGDDVEVYRVLATLDEVNTVRDFLWSQVGKEYDTVGLAGFFPGNIVQAIAKQAQRKADAKWFCSELAQAATKNLAHPLLINLQPFEATPRDLHISPNKSYVWRSYE